jgi:hypothetical protein
MWRIYTMSELWKLFNEEKNSKVFIEPNFPTRRWGQITTKTSTTDIKSINKGIEKLKTLNIKCRKRLCKESMNRFKMMGRFYKIEIKEVKTNESI